MLTRAIDHIQGPRRGRTVAELAAPEPTIYDEVEVALWTIYYPHMDPVTVTIYMGDPFDLDPATEVMRVEKDGRIDVYHLDRAYYYTAKTFMKKVARKPYVPTTPDEPLT